MRLQNEISTIYQKNKYAFIAMFTTIISGLFVHLYMITNKFYNFGELGHIYTKTTLSMSDCLSLGRVFLPFVAELSNMASSSAINGAIMLLFLGLSAFLVEKMLKFESKLYDILFPCILIVFPGTVCYLTYGWMSEAYSFSILMGVLGAYLLNRSKVEWIIGILCLTLSVGTYQPLFSVGIAVIYISLFKCVLTEKISWKKFILKMIRYLIALAISFLLYYIILNVLLSITGIMLSSYHGVDKMVSFSLRGIAKGFVYSYLYFLRYYFTLDYTIYPTLLVANIVMLVVFGYAVVRLIFQKRREDDNSVIISQMVFLILFLPLGLDATPFCLGERIGAGFDRYMMFSIIFFYILVCVVMSQLELLQVKKDLKALWIGLIMLVVVVISNYYICNIVYRRLEVITESESAYMNRIVATLEQRQEWRTGKPIYFYGARPLFSEYYGEMSSPLKSPMTVEGTSITPNYSYGAMVKYMDVCLHFPIVEVDREQQERINENEKIAEMPCYPEDGSMCVVDGVLVIKISNIK